MEQTQTVTMPRLFITAITGECCLMVLGMQGRYNPFALLRKEAAKVGIKLPNKHRPCLEWLEKQYLDNGLPPHRLLEKAYKHLDNATGQTN